MRLEWKVLAGEGRDRVEEDAGLRQDKVQMGDGI